MLAQISRGLDWHRPAPPTAACRAVGETLLDTADPELGRAARLHILGCAACRELRDGLHRARDLVRAAITLFFPAVPFVGPTTPDLPAVWARRRRWAWRGAAVLALLSAGATLSRGADRPAVPRRAASSGTVAVTADSVLDRALGRWELPHLPSISHERYRMLSGGASVTVERWYDWGQPHYLRVNVVAGDQRLLEVVSDGDHRLWSAAAGSDGGQTISTSNPGVRQLLPLLRQLPAGGPFRRPPLDAQYSDQALLWAARRGAARLLGSTTFAGHPADRLVFTAGAQQIYLLIDQDSGALLQAKLVDASTGQNQTVWEAELLETAQHATAELALPAVADSAALPDPRYLGGPQLAPLDLAKLAEHRLAWPLTLPGPVLAAFVGHIGDGRGPVAQLYEGADWSLVLLSPWEQPADASARAEPPLDQALGALRFRVLPGEQPGITVVQWQIEGATRGTLRFWQASATDDERLRALQPVLAALAVLDEPSVPAWQARFDPAAR